MNTLISLLSCALAVSPVAGEAPVLRSEPTPLPYEVLSESEWQAQESAKQVEESDQDQAEESEKQTKPAKSRKRREILPRVYVEELEIEIKPPVMPVSPRKEKATEVGKTREQADFYQNLNTKFDKMFAIKDRIAELEKECGKLWDEYYAYRQAYDKALSYAVNDWAMEQGVPMTAGGRTPRVCQN